MIYMANAELNPKILAVLIRKTGKTEAAIRPALSRRRNKHHLTLNAAAQLYAIEHNFTVGRYLTDKDRECLKTREIQKIKIPTRSPKTEKKIINFANYIHKDGLLNGTIKEINKTYTFGCYTACFVLCRKLLENLLIYKILKKKYPNNTKNHREKYFDFNNGRFLDFGKIIKNLKDSSRDFGSEKKLVERICQLSEGFKESANEMTHSLYHIATKKELDEKNFQNLLDLVATLESSLP